MTAPNKVLLDKAEKVGLKVASGNQFLGGYIGCEIDKNKFVKEKFVCGQSILRLLQIWQKCIFITVATKSLQAKWNFLQCVVQIEEELFSPLKMLIIILLSSRPCLALSYSSHQ